jgi:anti-sigma-K factor RskA
MARKQNRKNQKWNTTRVWAVIAVIVLVLVMILSSFGF